MKAINNCLKYCIYALVCLLLVLLSLLILFLVSGYEP